MFYSSLQIEYLGTLPEINYLSHFMRSTLIYKYIFIYQKLPTPIPNKYLLMCTEYMVLGLLMRVETKYFTRWPFCSLIIIVVNMKIPLVIIY